MSKKTSAQRKRLWRRNPRCHWCNRHTHLVNLMKNSQIDPLFATIDHVRSRLDPRRYERCKRANGILLEDAERRRKDWYASRR